MLLDSWEKSFCFLMEEQDSFAGKWIKTGRTSGNMEH